MSEIAVQKDIGLWSDVPPNSFALQVRFIEFRSKFEFDKNFDMHNMLTELAFKVWAKQ